MERILVRVAKYCGCLGVIVLSGCTTVNPFKTKEVGPRPEDTKIQVDKPVYIAQERVLMPPRRPQVQPTEVVIIESEEVEEVPSRIGTEYSVQKGDCLSLIARRYGIKLKDLLEANSFSPNEKINVGQKIFLPDVSEEQVKRLSTTQKYKVQKGDCLSTIAQKFGVSAKAIRAANGLKNDRIIAGKMITIPAQGSIIAESSNGVGVAKVAQKSFEVDKDGYYIVQKGDALSVIANKAQVSVADLQDWNDIDDPKKIQVGQKLLVKNNKNSIRAAKDEISPRKKEIAEKPKFKTSSIEQKYDFLDDADFFDSVDDIPVVQVQD